MNLRLFRAENDPPASGSQESLATEPQVVYGRDPGTAPAGTEGTPESAKANALFDFSKISDEHRPKAFGEYKEFFKQEFTKDFQSALNERMRKHRADEERFGKLDPVVEGMKQYFGVKTDEELAERFQKDIAAKAAQKAGIADPETYQQFLENRTKAQKLDALTAQQQEDERARLIITQADEFAAKAKDAGIEFNLETEAMNEEFIKALGKGFTVEQAFFATHGASVLPKPKEQAAKATAARISEVAMNPTPGVIRKDDPSKYTDKDIDTIVERVRRGESIAL